MDKSTLCDIEPSEKGIIVSLEGGGSMRRRLLDMGFTENTVTECVGISPGGALRAFLVRGAVIALRTEDAERVTARRIYGSDEQLER